MAAKDVSNHLLGISRVEEPLVELEQTLGITLEGTSDHFK